MNIILSSILLCSIGQEGSYRPRSYYRSFIAFVQLAFVAADGKDEVAVSVKDGGSRLEAYVAETEDWTSSKTQLSAGEWNQITESFSITGLPARGGFDRVSSERLESIGDALSHPRLRHWLRADVLVAVRKNRGGYQVGLSDPNGKGGPGSFQIALIERGKVKRILNGY